jgi:hypothetical protein
MEGNPYHIMQSRRRSLGTQVTSHTGLGSSKGVMILDVSRVSRSACISIVARVSLDKVGIC